MARLSWRRYIGTKHMASARKNSRSSASSSRGAARFVVCVRNDEYPASLEARELYRVLPDTSALKRGLLRVVDESGGDYLYPARYFLPVALPQRVKRAVAAAS